MKIIQWLFISILIAIFLIVAPFFISPAINNMTLSHFAKQLKDINLPNTTVLEQHSICGKLNGNGNGMDFFACALVETDLTEAELTQALEAIPFKPAKPWAVLHSIAFQTSHTVHTEIVQVNQSKLTSKYLEHRKITFQSTQSWNDDDRYYAVVIYDNGYLALFDFRGN